MRATAVSTLTVLASSANDAAESARPNSSAYAGGTRSDATGRLRVRSPISLSMSRSMTWLIALAPPQAMARPTIAPTATFHGGRPCAPATIPQKPVRSSSVMIRGFVSVT